jgi:DNA-binding LacI/PurR family transcriptional regulator
VDVQDDSLWVTFMGSDFVEEGRRAARWLIEKGYTDVKIVELQGTVGSAPAIDRKKGFEEVIKDHPGMVINKSQSGNFTRSGGKEIMEAFLKPKERILMSSFHTMMTWHRRNTGNRRIWPGPWKGYYYCINRCCTRGI